MFVNRVVQIAVAFDDGSARLPRLLDERTIERLSRSAYEHGWEFLLRIGPAAGISKLVRARFLAPHRRERTLSMPLRWEATGAAGRLFPALDGRPDPRAGRRTPVDTDPARQLLPTCPNGSLPGGLGVPWRPLRP
jgi:hypothetical protein